MFISWEISERIPKSYSCVFLGTPCSISFRELKNAKKNPLFIRGCGGQNRICYRKKIGEEYWSGGRAWRDILGQRELYTGVGAHWALMCHFTLLGFLSIFMLDYTFRCRTSNTDNGTSHFQAKFWPIYKKKNIFLVQKFTGLEHFFKFQILKKHPKLFCL